MTNLNLPLFQTALKTLCVILVCSLILGCDKIMDSDGNFVDTSLDDEAMEGENMEVENMEGEVMDDDGMINEGMDNEGMNSGGMDAEGTNDEIMDGNSTVDEGTDDETIADNNMGDQSTDDGNHNSTDTGTADGDDEAANTIPAGIPDFTASTDTIAFLGAVDFDQVNRTGRASFWKPDPELPLAELLNSENEAQEFCEVTEVDPLNPPSPQTNMDFLNFDEWEVSDCGQFITVTSRDGTFAEFVLVEENGIKEYRLNSDGALPGPVPEDSVIDFNGTECSGFSEVPIPNAPKIVGLQLSTGDSLTPATQINWEPYLDGDTRLLLSASAFPDFSDNPEVDLNTLIYKSLFCVLLDDGVYEFDEVIAAELGSNIIDSNFTIYRSGGHFEHKGNAFLGISVLNGVE